MIKNLIFDFGRVLIDYDYETFFREHIPDEKRFTAFIPIIYNREVISSIDCEETPFHIIIEDLIAKHKEYEAELRLFYERYCEIVTGEIEGMKDLLTSLKKEGYKLYGLSNWCHKIHTTMAQYDIFKLLDGYVISSEEKIIKPDTEIYHRLFKKFNLKPEECIFTDDKEENIKASKLTGMDGILFIDSQQYERELREKLRQ